MVCKSIVFPKTLIILPFFGLKIELYVDSFPKLLYYIAPFLGYGTVVLLL